MAMLSAGDLIASQRKLESRGTDVQERARQKAEKERLVAERAAARAAAREEEARQRRLAQLGAEEEVRCGLRECCAVCEARVAMPASPVAAQSGVAILGRATLQPLATLGNHSRLPACPPAYFAGATAVCGRAGSQHWGALPSRADCRAGARVHRSRQGHQAGG